MNWFWTDVIGHMRLMNRHFGGKFIVTVQSSAVLFVLALVNLILGGHFYWQSSWIAVWSWCVLALILKSLTSQAQKTKRMWEREVPLIYIFFHLQGNACDRPLDGVLFKTRWFYCLVSGLCFLLYWSLNGCYGYLTVWNTLLRHSMQSWIGDFV